MLASISAHRPAFFARRGWAVCGRHSYSAASPRDILSQLESQRIVERPLSLSDRPALNIRLWRHVEQDALMRLYAASTSEAFGPLDRTEPYWRWLLIRRGYDRIYVAIDGPDRLDLENNDSPIVGYAAMKGGSILELMTSPAYPHAADQLLARACGDAIERDEHGVRFCASPDHALHASMTSAGGTFFNGESDAGEVFMVKVYDVHQLLTSLTADLHRRAKDAELERPGELGLYLDGEKYRVSLAQRSVQVTRGKLGRSYLAANGPEVTQLLLGHLEIEDAIQAGRIEASTRVAQETARVLFARRPFWRPPLDDAPA